MRNPEALVTMLRMSDYGQHEDNHKYMETVKKRAEAGGTLLLFADEATFIEALLSAGFLHLEEVRKE